MVKMDTRTAASGRRISARLLLAALALLALSAPARSGLAAPSTFIVTKLSDSADGVCNFDCSLREAISAANASPGADTVELPPGTFVLTLGGSAEDLNASGDLDLLESVTLLGAGAGQVTITWGGDVAERLLHVLPGVVATLDGLTLANGSAGASAGGAIFSQGTLTVANSVVRDSSANAGGGIAASGALTLTNATIRANSSAGAGGGIRSEGPLTVQSSTITGNTAGGAGGGIAASASASIAGSTIVDNSAGAGGGISTGASLTLSESSVSGNSAAGSGGGIVSAAQLTISASTIALNSAGAASSGGGIASSGGATLTNVTVSDNSAGTGGGIAVSSGAATLASATVAGNSASAGSGGGLLTGPGASIALKNSLVAENSGVSAADCAGALSSQGYNLVGEVASACQLSAAAGDQLNTDPQIGPLRDNGGPTATRALLAGSPAIDAASPAQAGAPGACPGADQRGVARPQTGRCDIGAFELTGVSIADFAFQPANLVVQAGTTVRWKNLGTQAHSTRSDNPVGPEPWSSPQIAPGATYLRTFNTAGIYRYYCTIHTSMTGTITVLGPSVAPAPLLISISPSSAPAGSPELTLTLNGLNFDVDATVEWGGEQLKVLTASDQQFQVIVPAALLTSAGLVHVRVVNPPASGGATNALSFRIIASAPDHRLYIPLARGAP